MSGRCEGCGYDRRGLAMGSPCPECGVLPSAGQCTIDGRHSLHAAPMRAVFLLGEIVFAFMGLYGLLELARGGWDSSAAGIVTIGTAGAVLLEWSRRSFLASVVRQADAGACEHIDADREGIRLTLNIADLRFAWRDVHLIAWLPTPGGGTTIVVTAGAATVEGDNEFELLTALSDEEAERAVASLLAQRPSPRA